MDLLGAIMEELELAQFAIKEAFCFLLWGGFLAGKAESRNQDEWGRINKEFFAKRIQLNFRMDCFG